MSMKKTQMQMAKMETKMIKVENQVVQMSDREIIWDPDWLSNGQSIVSGKFSSYKAILFEQGNMRKII